MRTRPKALLYRVEYNILCPIMEPVNITASPASSFPVNINYRTELKAFYVPTSLIGKPNGGLGKLEYTNQVTLCIF